MINKRVTGLKGQLQLTSLLFGSNGRLAQMERGLVAAVRPLNWIFSKENLSYSKCVTLSYFSHSMAATLICNSVFFFLRQQFGSNISLYKERK